MKPFVVLVVAVTAVALHSAVSAAPFSIRRLQQGGGRNQFPQTPEFPGNDVNGWQPQTSVGGPWGNQGGGNTDLSPEAFPQAGPLLTEQQPTSAATGDGLEQTTPVPPATELPATTQAPQTGAEQPDAAAQPTIMVLLPDFLAPNQSGSGSTMVIAGSSSSKDGRSSASKPASSETKDEEVKTSAAATTGSLRTVATASLLLLVAILGASG